MTLIPIGQATARLGLSNSALRYYDDRGLVSPVQHLGIPLQTAAAVLDTPGRNWRPVVQQQIAELNRMIEQAKLAQDFLTHALHCPSDHPTRQCPNMTAALDSLVSGTTIAELAAHSSI